MSETLAHLSVKEFADRLASKAPVPGGGAVAAVTAAHSAALGCMVLAYTLGKSNFSAHESENKIKLECLQRAQSQALALADQDAAAYGTLSARCARTRRGPRRHGGANGHCSSGGSNSGIIAKPA